MESTLSTPYEAETTSPDGGGSSRRTNLTEINDFVSRCLSRILRLSTQRFLREWRTSPVVRDPVSLSIAKINEQTQAQTVGRKWNLSQLNPSSFKSSLLGIIPSGRVAFSMYFAIKSTSQTTENRCVVTYKTPANFKAFYQTLETSEASVPAVSGGFGGFFSKLGVRDTQKPANSILSLASETVKKFLDDLSEDSCYNSCRVVTDWLGLQKSRFENCIDNAVFSVLKDLAGFTIPGSNASDAISNYIFDCLLMQYSSLSYPPNMNYAALFNHISTSVEKCYNETFMSQFNSLTSASILEPSAPGYVPGYDLSLAKTTIVGYLKQTFMQEPFANIDLIKGSAVLFFSVSQSLAIHIRDCVQSDFNEQLRILQQGFCSDVTKLSKIEAQNKAQIDFINTKLGILSDNLIKFLRTNSCTESYRSAVQNVLGIPTELTPHLMKCFLSCTGINFLESITNPIQKCENAIADSTSASISPMMKQLEAQFCGVLTENHVKSITQGYSAFHRLENSFTEKTCDGLSASKLRYITEIIGYLKPSFSSYNETCINWMKELLSEYDKLALEKTSTSDASTKCSVLLSGVGEKALTFGGKSFRVWIIVSIMNILEELLCHSCACLMEKMHKKKLYEMMDMFYKHQSIGEDILSSKECIHAGVYNAIKEIIAPDVAQWKQIILSIRDPGKNLPTYTVIDEALLHVKIDYSALALERIKQQSSGNGTSSGNDSSDSSSSSAPSSPATGNATSPRETAGSKKSRFFSFKSKSPKDADKEQEKKEKRGSIFLRKQHK